MPGDRLFRTHERNVMNTQIVPIERTDNGSLIVSSLIIAEGAGVQHKNVLELITKNLADLEQFGTLAFETRKSGGMPTRIALLNEQQSTLVMTYQRNTDQVKAFKLALVKAFFEMAKHLQAPATPAMPQSYSEALRELAANVEAKELAEARAKELEVPAKAWGVMVAAHGDYAVDEAAKILSRDSEIEIGRNRLFQFMADLGWTYRQGSRNSWHAYQSQVDNGRIVLRMSAAFLNAKTGEMENPAPTIRITAKGIDALRSALLKELAA